MYMYDVFLFRSLSVMLTPVVLRQADWETRKGEFRTSAQAVIHTFATLLGSAAMDVNSADVRTNAIIAIKQVSLHIIRFKTLFNKSIDLFRHPRIILVHHHNTCLTLYLL